MGEEFKSIFGRSCWALVWKDSENKCVSFGNNFPCCKLKREGSQRGWEERGLFLGLTVNWEGFSSSFMISLYTHNTILDPETCQAAYIKPEKGLGFGFGWTVDLVYSTETAPTVAPSSSKTGTFLRAVCQESYCSSYPEWCGHSLSLPTYPSLADHSTSQLFIANG